MKSAMYSFLALAMAAIALTGFRPAHQANYKIAPGYTVKVTGNDVEAYFDSLAGNIRFAPEHLDNVLFDVTIAAASISTGIELKDKHARSKDYLNVEAFPSIRFLSTSVKQTGDGHTVYGNLELHGIKLPVEIPFKFANNVFTGEFDIKRVDYKIGKAKSKVAPEIHVSLSVPVVPVH
jgi:polyisoprenoid-binding protein YceI